MYLFYCHSSLHLPFSFHLLFLCSILTMLSIDDAPLYVHPNVLFDIWNYCNILLLYIHNFSIYNSLFLMYCNWNKRQSCSRWKMYSSVSILILWRNLGVKQYYLPESEKNINIFIKQTQFEREKTLVQLCFINQRRFLFL